MLTSRVYLYGALYAVLSLHTNKTDGELEVSELPMRSSEGLRRGGSSLSVNHGAAADAPA